MSDAVRLRRVDQVEAVVEHLPHSQREALQAEQPAAVGRMAPGVAHELPRPLLSRRISGGEVRWT